MCTALHLLYDLAARIQDLVVLDYGQLLGENGTKWKMKKTSKMRKRLLTDETIQLLKEMQEKNQKDN